MQLRDLLTQIKELQRQFKAALLNRDEKLCIQLHDSITRLRIELRYRKIINLFMKTLWICSASKSLIKRFYHIILLAYDKDAVISNISEGAIKYLLDVEEPPVNNFPYEEFSEEELMILYSMRRATPPPVLDVNFSEALQTLTEDPSFSYSAEHVRASADRYLSQRKININLREYPSLVSNKSCIEGKRGVGGRNFVSSLYLEWARKFGFSTREYPLMGCDNPIEYKISYESAAFEPVEFSRYKLETKTTTYDKVWVKNQFGKEYYALEPRTLTEHRLTPVGDSKLIDYHYEEVDIVKQLQCEWQARQNDSYRLFCIAYNIIRNKKEAGALPYLFALDVKERGNKHRIPHIPEWCATVAASFIGEYGFKVVERLCPTTFREVSPNLDPKKKIFYSGDFKSATDHLPWDVIRGAWDVIVTRIGASDEMIKAFKECLDWLIGPHIVTWDEVWRTKIQSIYSKDLKLDFDPTFVDSLNDYKPDDDKIKKPSKKWLVTFEALCKKNKVYLHLDYKPGNRLDNSTTLNVMNLIDNLHFIVEDEEIMQAFIDRCKPGIIVPPHRSSFFFPSSDSESEIVEWVYNMWYYSQNYCTSHPEYKYKTGIEHIITLQRELLEHKAGFRQIVLLNVFEKISTKKEIFQAKIKLMDMYARYYSVTKGLDRKGKAIDFPLSLVYETKQGNIIPFDFVLSNTNVLTEDQSLIFYPLPDEKKCVTTKKAIHMCYGISFPAMTLINHLGHFNLYEAKLLERGGFATLGDDNVSAHDTMDGVNALEKEHEAHGFIVNKPKRHISKKGYLLAEQVYIKSLDKNNKPYFREIPNFKMRILVPKQEKGNYWVTTPQVALSALKNASSRLKCRVMSTVWKQFTKPYSECLKAGLNIFCVPPNKPLFPFTLFPIKKTNYLYEPYQRKEYTKIKNIFTPKDETQEGVLNRDLLRDLISNLHNEGITWANPSFGFDPRNLVHAEKKEWKKGDLLNSLTARAIPNPYRNPLKSKKPSTLTAQECIHRFLKIKGLKHMNPLIHKMDDWDNEIIKTSLPGILSNQINFDVSTTFGNEIYDNPSIDITIIDGSRDYGCQLSRFGDEYELELQILGASYEWEKFSLNRRHLYVCISPSFANSKTDRQRIDKKGSYFVTWFSHSKITFEAFFLKCFKTFRNSTSRLTVITNREKTPDLWIKVSPSDFFRPSRDYCLDKGREEYEG